VLKQARRMTRIDYIPTADGPLLRVTTVDRRREYQAKVRNRGDHLQPDFRMREIRGQAVKNQLIAADFERHAERLRARTFGRLDWQPVMPRPDAPPAQPGSAAA
jgi:hypothetical protein